MGEQTRKAFESDTARFLNFRAFIPPAENALPVRYMSAPPPIHGLVPASHSGRHSWPHPKAESRRHSPHLESSAQSYPPITLKPHLSRPPNPSHPHLNKSFLRMRTMCAAHRHIPLHLLWPYISFSKKNVRDTFPSVWGRRSFSSPVKNVRGEGDGAQLTPSSLRGGRKFRM